MKTDETVTDRPPPDPFSTNQETDWENFRDRIPTADDKGRRIWIFPRMPQGWFTTARTWLSGLLLAFLFGAPFVKMNGHPMVMANLIERKFTLFGKVFWPEDNIVFAVAMVTIFIMIALFTAVFGRIWCGWLCPQTVLMEMVFRKIETWIDGDHHAQYRLSKAPWTAPKTIRRIAKHTIFFSLSFVIGNILLSYFIGIDALKALIVEGPVDHPKGFVAMVLFSIMFYGIFSRFREQACTFICPYGRIQSVLLDENSIVVAYDHVRGENRAPFSKKQTHAGRKEQGIGDCIDCNMCVSVCPTGIDIRNGTQMECVNCTACIDACDSVMKRLSLPKGLVRYASLNAIEKGQKKLTFTPRIGIYCGILAIFGGVLVFLVSNVKAVDMSLERMSGSTYQTLPDGRVSNIFQLEGFNKTVEEVGLVLRLVSPEGKVVMAGDRFLLPAEERAEGMAIVQIDPKLLSQRLAPITLEVVVDGKVLKTIKTGFLTPQSEGRS